MIHILLPLKKKNSVLSQSSLSSFLSHLYVVNLETTWLWRTKYLSRIQPSRTYHALTSIHKNPKFSLALLPFLVSYLFWIQSFFPLQFQWNSCIIEFYCLLSTSIHKNNAFWKVESVKNNGNIAQDRKSVV